MLDLILAAFPPKLAGLQSLVTPAVKKDEAGSLWLTDTTPF